MNILHTVESYSPSVSGAPEVVKQISERLVQRGHQVTVATSRHPERHAKNINGVQVEEFDIRGNSVYGIQGETERYQAFLRAGKFDIMMNYAAQQWATDLVYPVLDELPYKKILIPCGFSGLYWHEFENYFRDLPNVLRRYDHLIFHADNYRDTNFARQHHISHWSIVPNGASRSEFEIVDSTFRSRYEIPSDSPLLLTVGSHTGVKGHYLVLDAFLHLHTGCATLVIIGNAFGQPRLWGGVIRPLLSSFRHRKFSIAGRLFLDIVLGGIGPIGCLSGCRARARWINWQGGGKKKVLLLDPPRADVVAAYHAADLFLFGSNIEYSPLVLFEAMASRTPFLTLACGNAAEIVQWSNGGGMLAPTIQKERGFVDGDPVQFSKCMEELISNPNRLKYMGKAGYAAWQTRFTWEKLAGEYESLYLRLINS